MSRAPGTGRQFILTEGWTPGGTHYWYNPAAPDYGYLAPSVLSQRYPMSYIYGLASHTPTGSTTQQTSTGVEVQAAALGQKIAVIYGTDRIKADVFFGPRAGGFTGADGYLTVGFGHGEGEIDSLTKVETAAGAIVNGSPGTSFTGFVGQAAFNFYRGVDAPGAYDPFFYAVSNAYGETFDERYPGLAYTSALLAFSPDVLNGFPELLWTIKGRKLLDPRLGVDGNGIPNQAAVWSDNPMLCLVDYFINKYYGRGVPLSEINWVSVAAIANWCDAIQSDGRKRFTFNSTLRRPASHKANIDFIRSHFRCTYARVQGQFKFYVDAPAAAVKVFDEVDRQVTYASNATPIVLTVPGHLRSTGDSVLIQGVGGNTAANGRWTATVIDADTLSLNTSVGNGMYTTGGAIIANCRPMHRWRTPPEQIPTKIKYEWTDPSRDYQTAPAYDITKAAEAGLVYTRLATYNGDGCRNAGQGQSQATYLLKKRGKDLNHTIVCNRAEGLAMEMYDVCVLNLPSYGITGYYARITRLTKFSTGEFAFDFEEYDSSIYNEYVAGTETKPAVTLPNPGATPPTPAAPTLTQDGLDVRVDFSPPSPKYPYYAGQEIKVLAAGGTTYTLGTESAGPLYIRGVTMNKLYTVTARILSFAGLLSIGAVATITPALGQVEAPSASSLASSVLVGISGNKAQLRYGLPKIRTALTATAFTNGSCSFFDGTKLADGITNVTAATIPTGNTGRMIIVNFGVPVVLNEAVVTVQSRAFSADPAGTIYIAQYSDNGSSFTDAGSGSSSYAQNVVSYTDSYTTIGCLQSTSTPHQWWAFKVHGGLSSALNVTEMQFYSYGANYAYGSDILLFDLASVVTSPTRTETLVAVFPADYDANANPIDVTPYGHADETNSNASRVSLRLRTKDIASGLSGPVDIYATSTAPYGQTFDALAPVITSQPASVVIAAGASTTLSVTATAAGSISYQWYQGQNGDTSTPLGTATTQSVTPAVTTGYWVMVGTVGHYAPSFVATVTVDALKISNNLSDLANPGTARTNLGLGALALLGTAGINVGGTGQTTAGAALDALMVAGADIASASTTNIAAATGLNVNITGTTTITAFGTATAGVMRVLKFAGILTLTHNATSLILPGAANIATAAGDVAIVESLGSGNWRCMDYMRAGVPPNNVDTSTLAPKTSPVVTTLDVSDGNIQIKEAQLQSCTLTLTNTAGTIQHAIRAQTSDASTVPTYAGKIFGASVTLANTPYLTSGVNFTNGVGIDNASKADLHFNTTNAQVVADIAGGAEVIYDDTGNVSPKISLRALSINVNGTSRVRPVLEFFVGTNTGGLFTIDTTNIPSGKTIIIRVYAWFK